VDYPLALRRPYTIAVMSLLIFVLGVLSTSRRIVDVFPAINIPGAVVVWNYPGLSPEDSIARIFKVLASLHLCHCCWLQQRRTLCFVVKYSGP
jgi:multidrug efflux pump subunit AcrB